MKVCKILTNTRTNKIAPFAIGTISTIITNNIINNTVVNQSDKFCASPDAEVFNKISKKIANLNTADDLRIFAQEFEKINLNSTLKQELIYKYTSKYEKLYNDLYSNKDFQPKELFKQIFDKDLSEAKAKSLSETYKDILEEPNFNIYLEKLFKQVKKDFNLDYIDINLKINNKKGLNIGGSGGASLFFDFIKINYYEENPLNRRKAFELIIHEMKHFKQFEIAIATDAQGFINAIAKRTKLEPITVSVLIGADKIQSIFLKYGNLVKNSKLYELGQKYIESHRNYFSPLKNFTTKIFIAYKNQFIEAEAYDVSNNAGELFYFLTGNSI